MNYSLALSFSKHFNFYHQIWTSQNNEIYNKDFNLDELVEAIPLSHDSATGPDEIHYQMLKLLPENSLETLLNIFNHIWTTGKFPDDWQYATIIPIPKPGKDPAEPNNYSFNKLSM